MCFTIAEWHCTKIDFAFDDHSGPKKRMCCTTVNGKAADRSGLKMIGKPRELFPSEDITLADLVDDPNVTKSGSDKTHESVSFSFDEMRKGWQLLTVVSDIGEGGKQTMNRDLSPAKAFVYSFVRVSVSQFPRTGKAERTSLIVNERRGALDTRTRGTGPCPPCAVGPAYWVLYPSSMLAESLPSEAQDQSKPAAS